MSTVKQTIKVSGYDIDLIIHYVDGVATEYYAYFCNQEVAMGESFTECKAGVISWLAAAEEAYQAMVEEAELWV